ncbi:hypothetical protein [Picrophilus oshimae]|uniref:Hypothetical membrane protein n=1 Tax=Picrophilus torridus (strain ATCC 700027 / DSM 9790 / JCM 10055 / NBRC 100828 / KAW 2/3) TaxID=1122961 RepID=Q6L0K2_PICTO|nr:hypothetical protein [Picrophilus oshimae]AAT43500.1 hypothetical membrane protein [Picrophilus oshimae DSM 9789]SMD30191.1 hypothetical protein SAMN02745355_0053 [Picrophilus oshimae DSM 9789]
MNSEGNDFAVEELIEAVEYVQNAEKIILKNTFFRYFVSWGLIFEAFVSIYFFSMNVNIRPPYLLGFVVGPFYLILIIIGGVLSTRYFRPLNGFRRFSYRVLGISIRRFSTVAGLSIYGSLIVLILFISAYTAFMHNINYPVEIAFNLIDLALAIIPLYLLIIMKAAFLRIPVQGYVSSISFLVSVIIPSIFYITGYLLYQSPGDLYAIAWAVTGMLWIISGITMRPHTGDD